jgi:hypothetical protein
MIDSVLIREKMTGLMQQFLENFVHFSLILHPHREKG